MINFDVGASNCSGSGLFAAVRIFNRSETLITAVVIKFDVGVLNCSGNNGYNVMLVICLFLCTTLKLLKKYLCLNDLLKLFSGKCKLAGRLTPHSKSSKLIQFFDFLK